MTHQPEPTVCRKDLERRYGVSRTTVWRWVAAGLLPKPKIMPNGRQFWFLSDIEKSENPRA